MTPADTLALAERLEEMRVILKSGEYDGADLMRAWCAMSDAAAALRESVAWGPDREEVARIVDPLAWSRVDKKRKCYAEHITDEQRRSWERDSVSLAKADAILALRPLPTTAVEVKP